MQQHGEPTTIDGLFFLFPLVETRKGGHIVSNRVQNSFFDHDCTTFSKNLISYQSFIFLLWNFITKLTAFRRQTAATLISLGTSNQSKCTCILFPIIVDTLENDFYSLSFIKLNLYESIDLCTSKMIKHLWNHCLCCDE
jgi:hypothetical protein